jgi:hypothetical protein
MIASGDSYDDPSERPDRIAQDVPIDATVTGFDDGLAVKNLDGTGEVVMLNNAFRIPAKATLSKAGNLSS